MLLPHPHPCRTSPRWPSWTTSLNSSSPIHPLECLELVSPTPRPPRCGLHYSHPMVPCVVYRHGLSTGTDTPTGWRYTIAYLPLCPPPGPPKIACPPPSCPLAFIVTLISYDAVHGTPPWTFTWVRTPSPQLTPPSHPQPTHPTFPFSSHSDDTHPPHLYPHASGSSAAYRRVFLRPVWGLERSTRGAPQAAKTPFSPVKKMSK